MIDLEYPARLRPPAQHHAQNSSGPSALTTRSSGNARAFWLTLAAYFCLAALGRVLVSPSAELDESEQLVLTQAMQWGYVSQPPLYTWLQGLCFSILGTHVGSLAVLKGILLFGTFVFVYGLVKAATSALRPAVVASLSLFFIPQILWESQRDLTHSVLATMVAAATLFVFLRLVQRRRPADYGWFGLCAGLGMLSKYIVHLFGAEGATTAQFGANPMAGLAGGLRRDHGAGFADGHHMVGLGDGTAHPA